MVNFCPPNFKLVSRYNKGSCMYIIYRYTCTYAVLAIIMYVVCIYMQM